MKKYRPIIACAIGLFASSLVGAQNPIIKGQFTADPTARVFNGKMYLYPSHDIPSPIERLKEWFCMEDYHVFSSENLKDWTDHGVIVTQNRVPWVERDSYTMWAPECVEKDGKYYFYFPAKPRGMEGFGVGVAIAEKPEGPFMPMMKPIEGVRGIDPSVLLDKDGQSYIYWAGGGKIFLAQLKDNMMELATEPVEVQELPDGFKEGPFAFEQSGRYYLTFPWVREENGTETLAYAMSDSPTGPFTFKGIIMKESPVRCWTNHHSIVQYKGQWYLFYHHNDYSPTFNKNRSARIDSLFFNADGTIQEVIPTLRGVGITDARQRIQIDRYSNISTGGASIAYLNEADPFEGWKTVFSSKTGWVRYNRVDFGSEAVYKVTARVKAAASGTLKICADGQTVATIKVPKCTDWTEVSASVTTATTGVHDLQVSLQKGSQVEVDWIGFDGLPWEEGAFETRKYRNLFAEMGYKQADIDAKLQEVFDGVFYGPDKVYFEVGDSLAYISDIKNHDVRTEGMSYGLMIAVQFDKKDIFDRLWRWSKKYMQHQDGPMKGYFAWSCKTDGTRNAQGPASDGELYYVTALIFASNRWGNDTGIDYLAEAQNILNCSMQKSGMDKVAPLINLEHKLITFTPDPWGGRFTDPSYHLPAFYEVWARWANDGRSEFWRECAQASREYLHKSIHPVTGLNPDYNNYDGTLMGTGRVLGDAFRFDSWRVPMNIALDYSWACADKEWQQQYGHKIQNFLYSQGIDSYIDQYNVDGSQVRDTLQAGDYPKQLRHSLGLVSTAAAVSLVCTHEKSREFIDRLWNAKHEPYEDGFFDAYFDGLLRLFAFMHLSGNYQIIFPANELKTIDPPENPIIYADVPDMSIVRVGKNYYMSSTTMHMAPGVPIMKSTDLVNWKLVNYAYQTLADVPSMNLDNGESTYGRGSWASCIRYHNGLYYVSTFAQTTDKTYIYVTNDIEKGQWTSHEFAPSRHDHTLFFDDDGRIYMINGGGTLYIVELEADLSGVKEGSERVLIENASAPAGDDIMLGAEGSQLFKHNGKYYLFNITWPRDGMRTVLVHRADKITGPYEGRVVFQDRGIAQGGMIETPDGQWYAYLFQDCGSVGRIPYLVPMRWEDEWPVIGIDGKAPKTLPLPAAHGLIPGIISSDEFDRKEGDRDLPLVWQWNHNPDNSLWSVSARKGYLRLTTGRVETSFMQAKNTLTQRTLGPVCSGAVSLDVSGMKVGDFAGLSLFQRKYGQVGVQIESGNKYIVMVRGDSDEGEVLEKVPLKQNVVYLKAACDFTDLRDEGYFYYSLDGENWQSIGEKIQMEYSMPHFVGYRFALFNYATRETGGYADFDYFHVSDTLEVK